MANLKRTAIELVTEYDEVNDEVKTQIYYTPKFIPFAVVYEAVELSERVEKVGEKKEESFSETQFFDEMADFVANKVYAGKFTTEELINGLHAPDAVQTLQEQVMFIAQGAQSPQAKKLMEKNG